MTRLAHSSLDEAPAIASSELLDAKGASHRNGRLELWLLTHAPRRSGGGSDSEKRAEPRQYEFDQATGIELSFVPSTLIVLPLVGGPVNVEDELIRSYLGVKPGDETPPLELLNLHVEQHAWFLSNAFARTRESGHTPPQQILIDPTHTFRAFASSSLHLNADGSSAADSELFGDDDDDEDDDEFKNLPPALQRYLATEKRVFNDSSLNDDEIVSRIYDLRIYDKYTRRMLSERDRMRLGRDNVGASNSSQLYAERFNSGKSPFEYVTIFYSQSVDNPKLVLVEGVLVQKASIVRATIKAQ